MKDKRPRARGSRWSGSLAKHQFLQQCLCDEDLAARFDDLRSSAWWTWLENSSQATPFGDGITYFCPTYVLYNALSSQGRGA